MSWRYLDNIYIYIYTVSFFVILSFGEMNTLQRCKTQVLAMLLCMPVASSEKGPARNTHARYLLEHSGLQCEQLPCRPDLNSVTAHMVGCESDLCQPQSSFFAFLRTSASYGANTVFDSFMLLSSDQSMLLGYFVWASLLVRKNCHVETVQPFCWHACKQIAHTYVMQCTVMS